MQVLMACHYDFVKFLLIRDSFCLLFTGMGFRPMPDVTTTLVRFEQGKPESYKVFTDHIQSYLDREYTRIMEVRIKEIL